MHHYPRLNALRRIGPVFRVCRGLHSVLGRILSSKKKYTSALILPTSIIIYTLVAVPTNNRHAKSVAVCRKNDNNFIFYACVNSTTIIIITIITYGDVHERTAAAAVELCARARPPAEGIRRCERVRGAGWRERGHALGTVRLVRAVLGRRERGERRADGASVFAGRDRRGTRLLTARRHGRSARCSDTRLAAHPTQHPHHRAARSRHTPDRRCPHASFSLLLLQPQVPAEA